MFFDLWILNYVYIPLIFTVITIQISYSRNEYANQIDRFQCIVTETQLYCPREVKVLKYIKQLFTLGERTISIDFRITNVFPSLCISWLYSKFTLHIYTAQVTYHTILTLIFYMYLKCTYVRCSNETHVCASKRRITRVTRVLHLYLMLLYTYVMCRYVSLFIHKKRVYLL